MNANPFRPLPTRQQYEADLRRYIALQENPHFDMSQLPEPEPQGGGLLWLVIVAGLVSVTLAVWLVGVL